jgi:hypothetical protein
MPTAHHKGLKGSSMCLEVLNCGMAMSKNSIRDFMASITQLKRHSKTTITILVGIAHEGVMKNASGQLRRIAWDSRMNEVLSKTHLKVVKSHEGLSEVYHGTGNWIADANTNNKLAQS